MKIQDKELIKSLNRILRINFIRQDLNDITFSYQKFWSNKLVKYGADTVSIFGMFVDLGNIFCKCGRLPYFKFKRDMNIFKFIGVTCPKDGDIHLTELEYLEPNYD